MDMAASADKYNKKSVNNFKRNNEVQNQYINIFNL